MTLGLSRDFEPAIAAVRVELVKQDGMWGEDNDRAHKLWDWYKIVEGEVGDLVLAKNAAETRAAYIKIAAVCVSAAEDSDHKYPDQ